MEFIILGGLFLALCLLVKKVGAFTVSTAAPSKATKVSGVPFEDDILVSSRVWGVDAALIKAIIRKESSFNPNAVNPNDPSYGLMGIMPITAQDFGFVRDWRNPTESEIVGLLQVQNNISLGTRKLSNLLNKYSFDTAIQMYNVGESGFKSGRRAADYLAAVKRFYNEYKK